MAPPLKCQPTFTYKRCILDKSQQRPFVFVFFPMSMLRLWSPFLDIATDDLVKVTNELGHVIGDLARCETWQKVRDMLTVLKDMDMVSTIIIYIYKFKKVT